MPSPRPAANQRTGGQSVGRGRTGRSLSGRLPTSRGLAKLLDAAEVALWVVDADRNIALVSQAVADWIGCEADQLVGRRAVAAGAESTDDFDRAAAALSPPAGIAAARLLVAQVMLPDSVTGELVDSRSAVFVQPSRNGLTLAILADSDESFPENRIVDSSIFAAASLRQQLQDWRRGRNDWRIAELAGNSRQIRSTRKQIQVARQLRVDTLIVAPVGSAGLSIARSLHESTAKPVDINEREKDVPWRDPSELIDGSLMDEE